MPSLFHRSCGQIRLRSDCADVHADLSLRWAYISECMFAQVVVHFYMASRQWTGSCSLLQKYVYSHLSTSVHIVST